VNVRAPLDHSTPARARVDPAYRIVAIPAAIALGSVGGIAAEHANFPWIVGALAGAVAALLGVLALPSIPTRRVTVVLLGLGGLAALRHASFAGVDRSWLLVIWAGATMFTLVLLDRAESEAVPALAGGTALPNRLGEAARVGALIAVVVAVAAVALVPTVTNHLGRHVWPGLEPTEADIGSAPSSLRSDPTLDLTTRPRLSNAIVFTVDAAREDFWRGETFDVYNLKGINDDGASSWSSSFDQPNTARSRIVVPDNGGNVQIAPELYDDGARTGTEFRQTFYVQAGYSGVVFAAPSARVVQTDKLLREAPDGTVQVAVTGRFDAGFGKGAVYTVYSRSLPVTEASLRAADATAVPERISTQYAEMPSTTTRVVALARQITAGAPTTYDKVRAIEAWLGANTKYSLNAPLSPSGVDVVDDFLFHTRLGWCEQIASSLVVLARSVGIPARLVTGFVPGSRDSLTGRFVVRERDAHAWAEIYFPGIGWQGFDPTAQVPLAGDAKPGGSWLADARRNAIPFALAAVALVVLAATMPEIVAAGRRRRLRRMSWSARALHRLERAGRKAGRARASAETPREYARLLAAHLGDDRLLGVGDTLDADLYSAHGARDVDRADADAVLTSL
jgi:transglutaminase-like putative cysteine protease